jgi:hypothetical protein
VQLVRVSLALLSWIDGNLLLCYGLIWLFDDDDDDDGNLLAHIDLLVVMPCH